MERIIAEMSYVIKIPLPLTWNKQLMEIGYFIPNWWVFVAAKIKMKYNITCSVINQVCIQTGVIKILPVRVVFGLCRRLGTNTIHYYIVTGRSTSISLGKYYVCSRFRNISVVWLPFQTSILLHILKCNYISRISVDVVFGL